MHSVLSLSFEIFESFKLFSVLLTSLCKEIKAIENLRSEFLLLETFNARIHYVRLKDLDLVFISAK